MARDWAARYALPKRQVRIAGRSLLEAVEPWSVVTFTDSSVYIDSELALVTSRTIGRESIELSLTLLDQPTRTTRRTS